MDLLKVKPSGYIIVAAAFAAVALAAFAIMQAVHVDVQREHTSLALIVAALAGTTLGVAVWRQQSPDSPLTHVKIGLGATLAVTALALSFVMQSSMRWMKYPEAAIPISAVGCFIYPFISAKRTWNALRK